MAMTAIKSNGYTRINKTAARKAYNEGKTVYIQSCKYRFDNLWQPAIPMNKAEDAARYAAPSTDPDLDFDKRVLNYEWYNCDNERGTYASFYVAGE